MTVSEDPAVQAIADAVHRMVFGSGSERGNDGIPDSEDVRWAQQIAAALRAAGYPLIRITAPDSPATIDDPADLIRRLGYTIVGPDEVSVPRDEIDKLRRVARLQNDASLSTATCDFLARLDPSTKETR